MLIEDQISTALSDFLDSYVLFGYTEKGVRLLCRKFNSEKDIDSLRTYLADVVEQLMTDNGGECVEVKEDNDKCSP